MKEFYVGQDVVAIRDHSQGKFKEGEVFPIKGLKNGCCEGSSLHIDIGVFRIGNIAQCPRCYSILESDIIWFNSISFRPLDELTNISELTEVLENSKPFEIIK